MPNYISSVIAQFKEFYRSLTPFKRISMIVAIAVMLITGVYITSSMTGASYAPLLKNVSTEQLPLIIEKLKEKNIPFKMDRDGNAILVPPEHLYTTQIALMTEIGGKDIGSIGLELFDKQDLGTTSYQQRVNYQRALQGELIRAVNSLDVVKRSKVILALPPKKTFLEESGVTTASVVVDIYPGKILTKEQIRGITHLVSSAVENLTEDNVTVVDSRGKVLSSNSSSTASAMSTEVAEIKGRTERLYESRVEEILSRVVGAGKVIVKVNADINLKDITSVEEILDPDRTAIRSTITEEEGLNGNRRNPAGIPGARANLPGAEDQGQVAFNQNVSKEYKTTNYDVPKTIRNIKEAPGKIQKLSVAVLVDGVTQTVTNPDGTKEQKWVPRTQQELQKYQALVSGAIGFDQSRGDVVTIENIRFEKENFKESDEILSSLERRKLLSYIVKWSIISVAFLFFFFLIVRPFMRWVTDSFQESVEEILPKTIEELEELQAVDNTLPGMSDALPTLEESIDPDKAESELLKDRIMGLVEADSIKAANALNLWLIRGEK